MTTRVAINGFGRIGRCFFRLAEKTPDIDVVAINDLADAPSLAHQIRYDSLHGPFDGEVAVEKDGLNVNGRSIKVLSQPFPQALPWSRLGIDLVIEATGRYTARQDAAGHLKAGAGRVVVSAPGHDLDLTVCMGVNHELFDPSRHQLLSNASCTTNGLSVVAKVVMERFGLSHAMLNTVHCYTNGQSLLDSPHRDLRRGRAAGQSMIPTTTGAIKAVTEVLPELDGRIAGMAIRVPVPGPSLIDLVISTERDVTVDEVNAAFSEAASGDLQGVLSCSREPLVGIDYRGAPFSAVIDGLSTQVVGGNLVKVIAWYDNEWGYASRLVDLVRYIAVRSVNDRLSLAGSDG